MTVAALLRIAQERSTTVVGEGAGPPGDPVAAAAAAMDGTGPNQAAAPAVSTADSLLAMVPTEVVALYTTVLGVLAAAVADSPDDTYVPLRWGIWAGGALAVVIAIVVGWTATREPGLRRLPLLELAAGTVAFLAWGIVTPESALYYVLDPPTLPVVVGVITAVGVFALAAVFRPLLSRSS